MSLSSRPRALALALTLAVCIPAPASGHLHEESQDLASKSIEELMQMRIETVYGASKFEQKVTRAPASVTIVTEDEISRFGHRTVADVLRSIRGLYVSDDRNYSYLGTRGFLRPGDYNSRVLVLIDGHRMNDNIYDGANFARERLPSLDTVERIEFVRGPSSSIHGSSAFFGVINIVTKSAAALNGVRMSIGGGSYGEREAFLNAGAVTPKGVELTFNTSYYAKDGPTGIYYPEFDPAVSSDSRARNGGIANRRDGEESVGFSGSIAHGEFELAASWLGRRKDVPTASFGTLFNGDEFTNDERAYLDLRYEHSFSEDLQLAGRLAYDHFVYDADYPYDDADRTISKDESLGSWLTSDWQLKRVLSGGHTLTAGVEYRQSLHQRQLSYLETLPREYEVRDDRHESNAALYAQGELAISPRLLFNAGVRYDEYFDSFGGTLNPRLALIYSASDRSAFKLLYGAAFRAPSAYERFYNPAPPGAAELEPERIQTYEFVIEKYIGDRDRLNVSIYHYGVRGLITQQADAEENIYFENLTRVSADGIEVELERKFDGGALARASYGLQQTEDARTGLDLSSSPRHLAKLNIGVPLGNRTVVDMEMQYQSAVRTLSQQRAGGFLLGNMEISHETRSQHVRLSAAVYNFLDRRYGYPGAEDHAQNVIELDGRTFSVRLHRRF